LVSEIELSLIVAPITGSLPISVMVPVSVFWAKETKEIKTKRGSNFL
jgi:hypothetical protein